jgi:hypothetical protein
LSLFRNRVLPDRLRTLFVKKFRLRP